MANRTDQQAALDALAAKRRKHLEETLAAFAAYLATIQDRWASGMTALLNRDLSRANSTQALNLFETQASSQLNRLGYSSAVTQYTNSYADALNATREQLDAAGLPTSIDRDTQGDVRAMQAIDAGRLTRLGDAVASSIASTVVLGRITGVADNDLAEQISNTASSLSRGSQVLETGLYTSDRLVTWRAFSDNAELFRYDGPADDRTREFCIARVGKVFSKADILAMDNGTNLPVWSSCGGYGCRHHLQPLL